MGLEQSKALKVLSEAKAFGNEDENASLEAKAEKALEYPRIQKLKTGPCGSQFTAAFKCTMTSTGRTFKDKQADCVQPYQALVSCIVTNPDAFPKGLLDNDEAEKQEKEKPLAGYKNNISKTIFNTTVTISVKGF